MNAQTPAQSAGLTAFERLRPRLFGLAYRLLGTRTDAEDVVQDAWLRWHHADQNEIRDVEAWLVTATTRLGIDRLRAARIERHDYVGPWLPEPLGIDEAPGPDQHAEIAGQISLAFLTLLEKLAPEERAAFLLKDVFDYEHARIAELLGLSEANCRQILHRARTRLHSERPRFTAVPEHHRRMMERFEAAIRTGETEAIIALLDANARMVSDGGGKVTAVLRPLLGAERIARFYGAVKRFPGVRFEYRIVQLNGEPALLRWFQGALHSVTTISIDGDRITGVYSVLNPEKLRHLRHIRPLEGHA